jgi:hypothetical protein
MSAHVTVNSATDWRIRIAVEDAAGQPMNLEGAVLQAHFAINGSGAAIAEVRTGAGITIVDALAGLIDLVVPRSARAAYVWGNQSQAMLTADVFRSASGEIEWTGRMTVTMVKGAGSWTT